MGSNEVQERRLGKSSLALRHTDKHQVRPGMPQQRKSVVFPQVLERRHIASPVHGLVKQLFGKLVEAIH